MSGGVSAETAHWEAAVLPDAVKEDLLTDWIPDAVGGLGVDWRVAPPPGPECHRSLRVATLEGWREVPQASMEFRAWAQAHIADSIVAAELMLNPQVFGYRDALTPYRTEWQRLQARRGNLERTHPVAVHIDVEKFFASVQIERLESVVPPQAAEVMRFADGNYGSPLLPGHRWARRVANLVLSPVDSAIPTPFVRWQDDYWIYARSVDEARVAEEVALESLQGLGLRARRKTDPSDRVSALHESVLGGRALLEDARSTSHARALKLALRLMHEERDAHALPYLAGLANEQPVLVPRIAMYLGSFMSLPEGQRAFNDLLGSASLWVTARLVAAACQSPQGEAAVPGTTLDELSQSAHPAIRGLAARVQRRMGLAMVPSTPRIDAVLRTASQATIDSHPPIVETTL